MATGTFITFRQRTIERENGTSNVAQQVSPLVQTGYRRIKKKKRFKIVGDARGVKVKHESLRSIKRII